MKKILHLVSGGGVGGIEILCEQIGLRGKEKHEFCFLFFSGLISDRMKDNGITTYDLSSEGFMGKCKTLRQIFENGRYDAVVVHNEGVKIYALYESLIRVAKRKKMSDVTFIKYCHSSLDEDYYSGNVFEDTIHKHLLRKVMIDSNLNIAVSEYVKKSYAGDLRIAEDKIKVIYNGIEYVNNDSSCDGVLETNSCQSEYVQLDEKRLLYIGRLVAVKGVDTLIKAIALLKDRGVIVSLDILGDGEVRAELEKLADDLGIAEQISFRGMVLEKEEYYKTDGIFVCPSVCQEAFGISVIEAMSRGLICVASKVGGIPEIISDDRQGILFEAGNVNALADAILEAQTRCRADVYCEYRDAAIVRAKEFDIERSVSELEAIIG